MVVVFRYTSDQKAIRIAKDHLKAHLLALRLFQDQIPVVMRSYGRIVLATGRYLRLAFKPLLFVIVPLILLIVQVDRYLGSDAAGERAAISREGTDGNPNALNDSVAATAGWARRLPPRGARARGKRSGVESGRRERREITTSTFKPSDQTSLEANSRGCRDCRACRRSACAGHSGSDCLSPESPLCPRTICIESIEVQYPVARHSLRWVRMELDLAVLCFVADCRISFQEYSRD